MKYIDEKFKDETPENTVKRIKSVLKSLDIEIDEKWNDSKIDNCHSVRVAANGGIPGTNGKGITKEFAAASAYGEFMERLESGLFFYKYQSFENDESVYLHSFAPDKKYMTVAELVESGEWMEPIAKRYGITKDSIANQCKNYACSDKILTLPYYSLFEDKYVYLPAMFVEHVYSANGCCVGNTKEEAWVHALSEIFERHSNIEMIKSGRAAPVIPREKLKKFETVNKILSQIEEKGIFDVEVLDYSCGKKFPVVATRIINKETKGYLVNVGADPVFEIAVERTLTEIFQGHNIENFTSKHNGTILNKLDDINTADNIINQLETGNGLYTADFFADNAGEDDTKSFPDNSDKTNRELLAWIIGKYKEFGLNIYVRNNSFLGFPCYKFVVPGYSESRGERLKEPIPTYFFADRAAKVLRNVKKAADADLGELLLYGRMIANFISKKRNFTYLSGLPIVSEAGISAPIHFAYAALKIKNYKQFYDYIGQSIVFAADGDIAEYLKAVKQWVVFAENGVAADTAIKVIGKFYPEKTVAKLKRNIESDCLLDEFLLECEDCGKCKYERYCRYSSVRKIIAAAGKEYAKFTDGQDRKNFVF